MGGAESRMAQENRSWGDDRIAGVLQHLGDSIRAQTVSHSLKRPSIPPAPERKQTTTWRECIRTHLDVLVATDFFTAEVWTTRGLVTDYMLFFIPLSSRKIHIAGVTPHPDQCWMTQVARNVTMYVTHFHHERPHQGKGNVVLMPASRHGAVREGPLRCRERLGGLLKYYDREAA